MLHSLGCSNTEQDEWRVGIGQRELTLIARWPRWSPDFTRNSGVKRLHCLHLFSLSIRGGEDGDGGVDMTVHDSVT
jgi:hypothetical protein